MRALRKAVCAVKLTCGHEGLEEGGMHGGTEARHLASGRHLALEHRVRVTQPRPREHRRLKHTENTDIRIVSAPNVSLKTERTGNFFSRKGGATKNKNA